MREKGWRCEEEYYKQGRAREQLCTMDMPSYSALDFDCIDSNCDCGTALQHMRRWRSHSTCISVRQ